MQKKEVKKKNILFVSIVVLLLLMTILPLVPTGYGGHGNEPPVNDWVFRLPPQGGGMVHCDPQMSDNIRLPAPTANATSNVGVVWYRHDFGGEMFGTYGNGLSGNGRFAASTFGFLDLFGQNDNLILYDYDGNRIWSSGWWHAFNLSKPFNDTEYPWSLNPSACSSTPMMDVNHRVIACDYQKIILVNASNYDNVHVDWISYLPKSTTLIPKSPLSPTIVENKTIILPTNGGPLYAFNITNGKKIATLSFLDNSSNDSYYVVREMNWPDFWTIMSNPLAGPYHYDRINHVVVWNSPVPYGIMPMDPVFYEGNVIFETDPDGTVAAIDMTTGNVLAINSLGNPELVTGGRQYSTQNSVCVQGNRVYVTTQYPSTNVLNHYHGDIYGRLYAVDVNPDATNPSDILKVNWSYSFPGQSQASPTLIKDTIYFDGFNGSHIKLNGSKSDPHIYAVYTNGTLKWKVKYQNATGFSFAMDPRGGFWYEDLGFLIFGGGGRKLVHFNETNGKIIETIDMKTLLNDHGLFKKWPVYPCSCMTVCGTATHPIMIVSAVHCPFIPFTGRWVVAINLSDHNSLLWKVSIPSPLGMNFPSGQYTILTASNHQSRVLFGTYFGGVMAIGTSRYSGGSQISDSTSQAVQSDEYIGNEHEVR